MKGNEHIYFLKKISECYHKYGLPSHRLESKMESFCSAINIKADFFVSLSSIFIYVENEKHQYETHLIKIRESELNIHKMDKIDKIITEIIEKNVTITEGIIQLDKIEKENQYANFWLFILFFALSTGSAASLFGGNLAEISCSFISGAFIGFIINMIKYYPPISKILYIVSSIITVIIANVFQSIFSPFHSELSIICGLIILIPGFSFTVSVNELVNSHYISGISRLLYAFVSLIMIAVGIWVGSLILNKDFIIFSTKIASFQSDWIKYIALLTVPLGFIVLFKAKWKDFIWFAIACWISYFMMKYVSDKFNPSIGMFISSFTLAFCARLFYIISKRPDSIMLIPGMILLVPGSLGFKSVVNIFDNQVQQGFQFAITMFGISLSIVFGIVISNIVLPSQKKSKK